MVRNLHSNIAGLSYANSSPCSLRAYHAQSKSFLSVRARVSSYSHSSSKMQPHHVPGKFAAVTFRLILSALARVLPERPQPKWNPYKKTLSPGHIKYAALAIGDQPTTGPDGRPVVYKFSKTKVLPLQKAPSDIDAIASCVARSTGINYDIVLVNLYEETPPGVNKLGLHLDNERLMDSETPITSVTFTEDPKYKTRFVVFTEPHKQKGDKQVIHLGHGDLLTAPLGTHYHGVLPDTVKDMRKVSSSRRICLTFRKIK